MFPDDAFGTRAIVRSGAAAMGELLPILLRSAKDGVSRYSHAGELRLPASRRLAFRELGLAIGLSAIELLEKDERGTDLGRQLELQALRPYAALGTTLRSFWLNEEHRRSRTWLEHRDINDVMLASALVPEGCLRLASG